MMSQYQEEEAHEEIEEEAPKDEAEIQVGKWTGIKWHSSIVNNFILFPCILVLETSWF